MTLYHALSASGTIVTYGNGRLRHVNIDEILIIIDYKSVAKTRKIVQCDDGNGHS
jgi:hypothetical protein